MDNNRTVQIWDDSKTPNDENVFEQILRKTIELGRVKQWPFLADKLKNDLDKLQIEFQNNTVEIMEQYLDQYK